MSSPTSRTLTYERGLGHLAQVVEYWHAFSRRRVDLFNCIDVVSLTGTRIKGIQCTSGSNHSARQTKAKGIPAITSWVQSGGQFEVQSWRKNSKSKWVQRITRGYLDNQNKLNFRELKSEDPISETARTQRPPTTGT